jgi:hypothetical protein
MVVLGFFAAVVVEYMKAAKVALEVPEVLAEAAAELTPHKVLIMAVPAVMVVGAVQHLMEVIPLVEAVVVVTVQ